MEYIFNSVNLTYLELCFISDKNLFMPLSYLFSVCLINFFFTSSIAFLLVCVIGFWSTPSHKTSVSFPCQVIFSLPNEWFLIFPSWISQCLKGNYLFFLAIKVVSYRVGSGGIFLQSQHLEGRGRKTNLCKLKVSLVCIMTSWRARVKDETLSQSNQTKSSLQLCPCFHIPNHLPLRDAYMYTSQTTHHSLYGKLLLLYLSA